MYKISHRRTPRRPYATTHDNPKVIPLILDCVLVVHNDPKRVENSGLAETRFSTHTTMHNKKKNSIDSIKSTVSGKGKHSAVSGEVNEIMV